MRLQKLYYNIAKVILQRRESYITTSRKLYYNVTKVILRREVTYITMPQNTS